MITPERNKKFELAASKSQLNATVVLENVHDPHNIGAVLRSCDSVGIREVFVLYNEHSRNALKQYVGLNSASGALKWVKVHFFHNTKECLETVKSKYKTLAGTHLSHDAKNMFQLDLVNSIALVFGNEKSGLSEDVLPFLDTNFIIPQHGLVQSLNISVACAVTLFEMSRQREISGMYSQPYNDSNLDMNKVYNQFVSNHLSSLKDK